MPNKVTRRPTKSPVRLVASPPVTDEAPAWARGLIERLDRLEDRQRQTAAAVPSFAPMQHVEQRPKGIKAALAGLEPGQSREGVSHQIPVNIHGEKLDGTTLRDYPIRFGAGSRVRIDPASTRDGFPAGQTWGDLLARIPSNPDGVGTVRAVSWLNDAGEWKYRVQIPGLTNARPDGFYDHELLPA